MPGTPHAFTSHLEQAGSEISKPNIEPPKRLDAPSTDKLWGDLKNLLDEKRSPAKVENPDRVNDSAPFRRTEIELPDFEKEFDIGELIKAAVEAYQDGEGDNHSDTAESQPDVQSTESDETNENDNSEENLEKVLEDYFDDLKNKSECPETIPDKPFEVSDLKKRTPEENAEKRAEFDDKKEQLKREWEEANGRPWPKYDHDVYSANGKLIRKAGSDYDAHHIQPLGMGGENEASNITPLSAEVHYDKQGVHAPDSPYRKMDQILGGME